MLEEKFRLRPEVEYRLGEVYSRGQYLLNSGTVQEGSSFQRSLEDFYDLKWITYLRGYKAIRTEEVLKRDKEDSGKIGQVPRDLIGILKRFGEDSETASWINNDEELSYERVRESYDKPDVSGINNFYSLCGGIAMLGAPISGAGIALSLATGNMNHLYWAVPVLVLSADVALRAKSRCKRAEKKAEENLSQEIKRRRDAFRALHQLARDADKILEEYRQYF